MIEAAGREVRLSNPGKVYFPLPAGRSSTSSQYYLETAEAVTIHLRERPTVLKRFVNGILEEPIWQKRAAQHPGVAGDRDRLVPRPGAPPRSSSPTTPRTWCGRSTSA